MEVLKGKCVDECTDTKSIKTASCLNAPKRGLCRIKLRSTAPLLRKVDASKNELTSCLFLAKCPYVTQVNLSYNKLEKTKCLGELRQICVLNLSHNLVRKMIFIAKLREMKALILSHNQLKDIPRLDMPSLNTLSYNEIEKVDVSGLPELSKLSLTNNKLQTFPDLSKNIWLKLVILNHNFIKKVPEDGLTPNHVKLDNLELSFNKIEKFKSIKALSQLSLKKLLLYGNPICDKEDYQLKTLLVCPTLTSLDNINRHKLNTTSNENDNSIAKKRKLSDEEDADREVVSSSRHKREEVQKDQWKEIETTNKRRKKKKDDDKQAKSGVRSVKIFKTREKNSKPSIAEVERFLETKLDVGEGQSAW